MPKLARAARCPGSGLVAAGVVFALAALAVSAQSISPIRSTPVEKFTVNPGHRDWAEAAISGTTIVGGNSSNRGGLFAVDTVSGKLKWTARPTATARSNPFVATRPAIAGDVVIVPMGETLIALHLATGKEVWRGPATAQRASAASGSGLAFVLGEDSNFYAFDAATGREKWKMAFARGGGSCYSSPTVRDGVVYVGGSLVTKPADASRSAEYARYLFALDANTGQERWRYQSPLPGGICFERPTVTADTFFAISSGSLYALDLSTGRERWQPTEVRGMVDGRERATPVFGLVDAGDTLVGLTRNAIVAFDKKSGKVLWQVAGQYRENSPSTAVAGRVLYFQGHPGAEPAAEVQGRTVYVGGKPVAQAPALPPGKLNALDLDTRAILWSFSRPTVEPNWPFGFVTPVDGGLWVDSYQALVKLQ